MAIVENDCLAATIGVKRVSDESASSDLRGIDDWIRGRVEIRFSDKRAGQRSDVLNRRTAILHFVGVPHTQYSSVWLLYNLVGTGSERKEDHLWQRGLWSVTG